MRKTVTIVSKKQLMAFCLFLLDQVKISVSARFVYGTFKSLNPEVAWVPCMMSLLTTLKTTTNHSLITFTQSRWVFCSKTRQYHWLRESSKPPTLQLKDKHSFTWATVAQDNAKPFYFNLAFLALLKLAQAVKRLTPKKITSAILTSFEYLPETTTSLFECFQTYTLKKTTK